MKPTDPTPIPHARSLSQQKTDFTSEGAPLPGRVATDLPQTNATDIASTKTTDAGKPAHAADSGNEKSKSKSKSKDGSKR